MAPKKIATTQTAASPPSSTICFEDVRSVVFAGNAANDPCQILAGPPCCGRRGFGREGLLVEIKNRKDFEAWLQKQKREVSVAFAARVALRVLPFVWMVQGENFNSDFVANIMLPVFRATNIAWVAAKYPAQAKKLQGAATATGFSAAAATTAAAATGAATRAAAATDAAFTFAFAAAAAAATNVF